MRRRRLLAALGTVPFAGCLGTATGDDSSGESPTPTTASAVEVTAPPVSPGETTTITIDARSVTHLRFSDVPDVAATVEYESAAFTPAPSAVWDRRPPTWQWVPAEPVTGDVPLAVSESLQPGDYRYAVAVRRDDSEAETIEPFTVTVRE